MARIFYAQSNYQPAVNCLNNAQRILNGTPDEENNDDKESGQYVGDLVSEKEALQKEVDELLPLYQSYL